MRLNFGCGTVLCTFLGSAEGGDDTRNEFVNLVTNHLAQYNGLPFLVTSVFLVAKIWRRNPQIQSVGEARLEMFFITSFNTGSNWDHLKNFYFQFPPDIRPKYSHDYSLELSTVLFKLSIRWTSLIGTPTLCRNVTLLGILALNSFPRIARKLYWVLFR